MVRKLSEARRTHRATLQQRVELRAAVPDSCQGVGVHGACAPSHPTVAKTQKVGGRMPYKPESHSSAAEFAALGIRQ